MKFSIHARKRLKERYDLKEKDVKDLKFIEISKISKVKSICKIKNKEIYFVFNRKKKVIITFLSSQLSKKFLEGIDGDSIKAEITGL